MDNATRHEKDVDILVAPDDVLMVTYDDKLDELVKARMATEAAIRKSVALSKDVMEIEDEIKKRNLPI